MERTIKFRGKSISGDWVYGDLIQLDTQSCIAGVHQWATVLQNNSLELSWRVFEQRQTDDKELRKKRKLN